MALLCAAPASGAGRPAVAPAVYGGTSAHGTPTVVSIAIFDGHEWPIGCSGVMWRPRLVITAAHCMTISGSSQGVAGFALFPPGATALTYSNTGPQGAANVHVINAWKGTGYANLGSKVQPNDLAVLELDADLGAPGFTRLATRFDLDRWANSHASVQHTGYGLIGPDQMFDEPFTASLALDEYVLDHKYGAVFTTHQNEAAGICPGDSGSPAYVVEGGSTLLIGEMAGGNAPCNGSSDFGNVGFVAMGYLETLNTALAAAGYPTIPSAPQAISLTGRNRSVVVQWQAPATSPESVVGYDVLGTDGTVVCQSATTTCEIPNLPDGEYAYTVRSRNAEGEGDALPISAAPAVIAAPPRLPAPTAAVAKSNHVTVRFSTIAGESSAVVAKYRVTDGSGRAFCSVTPPNQEAATLACSKTVTKAGSYRFRVEAVTEMGTTPKSPLSRAVRVR